MASLTDCIQALLSSHDKHIRSQATEALNDMLSANNAAFLPETINALCHNYISQIDESTLRLSAEGFVAVAFLTDYVKRMSTTAFGGEGSGGTAAVGTLVGCIGNVVLKLDSQMENAGVGKCQNAEAVVGFKGVQTCRKLGGLLGVLLRTFRSGSSATIQSLVAHCASDTPARTATLVVLHTVLRSLSEKPLGRHTFMAACDLLGGRVMQFLSASLESNRLDWVVYILKIASRAVPRMPVSGDYGESRNMTISALCGYLQQGLSSPQSIIAVPRVVEYLLKVVMQTLGGCDSLGTLDLHEVLHVLLNVLASPCSPKTFQRTAKIFESVISLEESNGACASALRAVFVDKVHAMSILNYLVSRYLKEGDNSERYDGNASLEETPEALQRLISSWSSDPEDHILSLPEGDAADAIAERLLVSFTECSSAVSEDDEDTPLFVSAAWSLVNDLLQVGSAMGRLLAYRVIGLGHYSMSTGQEASYKSFFHGTLLPDCVQSHPRVQRRAIWAVGMWCESADEEMRSMVFASMLQLLSSSNSSSLSPVLVLTALKTIEHFMNDGSFDPASLPSGFGPAILGGLSTILPHVRQPYTVKDLASLILIVLERVPGAKGSGSVGDAVLLMLTPTIQRFISSTSNAATGDNGGGGGDGDDNGFGDEDDEEGQYVSCMMTVIDALQIALWSTADNVKWIGGSPLLPLAKFLVDPESPGHVQLEEEGWSLLEVMVKSTSASSLSSSSDMGGSISQVFDFACQQLQRDFEARGICIQVICGCLTLFTATGGAASPAVIARMDSLVGFCTTEASHLLEQSTDSALPGSLSLLALCLAYVPVHAGQQAYRAPLFEAWVTALMTMDEAMIDCSYHAPILASVVCALALNVVSRGQPVPIDFSSRLSVIHDVTCSGWGMYVIMTLAGYAEANLQLPGGSDERELLQGLVASATASLSSMLDEGEVDPAGVGSLLELLKDNTCNNQSNFALSLKGHLQSVGVLQ